MERGRGNGLEYGFYCTVNFQNRDGLSCDIEGHHSESIFIYSILIKIPTLYIFKIKMQLFFLMNRTIFYFSPKTCFGGTQALRKEGLLFFMKKRRWNASTSPRSYFFQQNINAD
uniref:Uncharacterized protein n=1 Tax=Anguilla anguilla TaxID=7936 RepID=A0A0E9WZS9_ANGAN